MSLRSRLIVLFAAAILLMVGAQLFFSTISKQRSDTRFNNAIVAGQTALWHQLIAGQVTQMQDWDKVDHSGPRCFKSVKSGRSDCTSRHIARDI